MNKIVIISNPTNKIFSDYVLRGSGWYSAAQVAKATYRHVGPPGYRVDVIGFRIVKGNKT